MICASFDCFDVKAGVLHMDTFLIQIMYRVVIHGTMQEDLLSHQ